MTTKDAYRVRVQKMIDSSLIESHLERTLRYAEHTEKILIYFGEATKEDSQKWMQKAFLLIQDRREELNNSNLNK